MVVLDSRGRRYFAAGMEKTNAGFAGFASADFNIASGYLRRCAVLYDKSPRIGEVLYMLGAIRYHARADQEHWSDNF